MRRRHPRAAALAALLAPAALAQPASAPAPGYTQRYASVCAACHGADGRSERPFTPSLAGQPSFYATTQLFLFRDGRRGESPMADVAKGLTDDDLRGFAQAIGDLPAGPPDRLVPDARRMERGAALVARHRCAACHGSDFTGGQQVPRLANQREDYLGRTLHQFAAGRRAGYTPAMTEVLAGLSPADLDDIAHYLSHFPDR